MCLGYVHVFFCGHLFESNITKSSPLFSAEAFQTLMKKARTDFDVTGSIGMIYKSFVLLVLHFLLFSKSFPSVFAFCNCSWKVSNDTFF